MLRLVEFKSDVEFKYLKIGTEKVVEVVYFITHKMHTYPRLQQEIGEYEHYMNNKECGLTFAEYNTLLREMGADVFLSNPFNCRNLYWSNKELAQKAIEYLEALIVMEKLCK